MDEYQVTIDPDIGTDSDGKLIDKECDLCLLVYDVRNKTTVDFLKNKVSLKLF